LGLASTAAYTKPASRRATIGLVGRPAKDLTASEKQSLQKIYAKIKRAEAEASAARDELAVFAENHGQRVVAEEIGLTQQAISLLVASRRAKPRKSRKPS